MGNEDCFDHFFVRPTNWDETRRFYEQTLGWKVASEWGSPDTGRGAVLQRGLMQLAMAEKHSDDTNDTSDTAVNGTRPTLYIAVADLKARFAEIGDSSVVVIRPERTHWGIEWFVVRDPDGNLIAYTQRRPES
jgi:catechol 2,3-dioxygenase-like lactoylglutathione lyase family enzyme